MWDSMVVPHKAESMYDIPSDKTDLVLVTNGSSFLMASLFLTITGTHFESKLFQRTSLVRNYRLNEFSLNVISKMDRLNNLTPNFK